MLRTERKAWFSSSWTVCLRWYQQILIKTQTLLKGIQAGCIELYNLLLPIQEYNNSKVVEVENKVVEKETILEKTENKLDIEQEEKIPLFRQENQLKMEQKIKEDTAEKEEKNIQTEKKKEKKEVEEVEEKKDVDDRYNFELL